MESIAKVCVTFVVANENQNLQVLRKFLRRKHLAPVPKSWTWWFHQKGVDHFQQQQKLFLQIPKIPQRRRSGMVGLSCDFIGFQSRIPTDLWFWFYIGISDFFEKLPWCHISDWPKSRWQGTSGIQSHYIWRFYPLFYFRSGTYEGWSGQLAFFSSQMACNRKKRQFAFAGIAWFYPI